jgi:hypothetical protein
MAAWVPLTDTTKASALLDSVITILNRSGLNMMNVSMVTPGGVAAGVWRVKGLVRLMLEDATKFGNNSVMQYRCLIRQKKVYAKFWKMKAQYPSLSVRFINSSVLNHTEFQDYLHKCRHN